MKYSERRVNAEVLDRMDLLAGLVREVSVAGGSLRGGALRATKCSEGVAARDEML
jgi:hypothetical protein